MVFCSYADPALNGRISVADTPVLERWEGLCSAGCRTRAGVYMGDSEGQHLSRTIQIQPTKGKTNAEQSGQDTLTVCSPQNTVKD